MRIKYYVINLERSGERKKSVINQFKKWGVTDYEFIRGFDAAKFTANQLQKLVDKKELVRPLSNGMIGCGISHVKALRRFLQEEDVAIGIILEDDFMFKGKPDQFLSGVEETLLDQGPIMLYAYVTKSLTLKIRQSLSDHHNLFQVEQPIGAWSTMGYAVNKKTAQNLLKVIYPIKDVADSWGFFQKKGAFKHLFVTYPFLITQEVFDSVRERGSNSFINWVIHKKVPVLYQLLKLKRERYLKSNESKISFS